MWWHFSASCLSSKPRCVPGPFPSFAPTASPADPARTSSTVCLESVHFSPLPLLPRWSQYLVSFLDDCSSRLAAFPASTLVSLLSVLPATSKGTITDVNHTTCSYAPNPPWLSMEFRQKSELLGPWYLSDLAPVIFLTSFSCLSLHCQSLMALAWFQFLEYAQTGSASGCLVYSPWLLTSLASFHHSAPMASPRPSLTTCVK